MTSFLTLVLAQSDTGGADSGNSVITSIATILLGGVLSATVTHYLTAFRLEREVTFAKLDELYGFCARYFKTGRKMTQYFGSKDWDAKPALRKRFFALKKSQEEMVLDIYRLYDIYFPDLRGRFDGLLEFMERERTLARVAHTAGAATVLRDTQDYNRATDTVNTQLTRLIQDISREADKARKTLPGRLWKDWTRSQMPDCE